MAQVIGYARQSADMENADLQLDALREAGAGRIFIDLPHDSKDATELDQCVSELEPGDTLVVWRFDRLDKSIARMVPFVTRLVEKGVHFRSLVEGVDTSDKSGTSAADVFQALTDMQRHITSEQTKQGLAAARKRGRKGGRPTVMTPERLEQAKALRSQGLSTTNIARALGVGRATIGRALADMRQQQSAAGDGAKEAEPATS